MKSICLQDATPGLYHLNERDRLMDTDSIGEKYRDFVLKPIMNGIQIQRGEGVRLVDAMGKEYLDFTSGFGVSLLGYNNEYTKRVKESIHRQLDRISHIPHYLYYSEAAGALAEELARITPGNLRKTFFCNSGSEAIEGAIRTARKYKRRFELLAPQQGFFGRTIGAVSLTGMSKDKKGIGALLPGVHHIPAPYCYRCSLNHAYPDCGLACAGYLDDYIEYGTSGDVAAVFIEPILGDSGVVVPPDGYFARILDICKRHDIAVAVDETLTGFARTGKMFASEHWGITPEILVMGKALGGGLPLGAFTVTEDVASTFEFKDFSSTLGGNPVACAAALTTIKLIEESGLREKAEKLGDYLLRELRALQDTYPIIGEVRGKGLMVGIEIVKEDNDDPAPQDAARIKDLMMEKGFLLTVYGRSTLRLTPPLIIEREHIDLFLEVFGSILGQVPCG